MQYHILPYIYLYLKDYLFYFLRVLSNILPPTKPDLN